MSTTPHNLVERALAARTIQDADAVQKRIADAIGGRHQRPVGDTCNNQGILTGCGASYDHKSLEVTTNMQDAILELLAVQQFGGAARSRSRHPTKRRPHCSPT